MVDWEPSYIWENNLSSDFFHFIHQKTLNEYEYELLTSDNWSQSFPSAFLASSQVTIPPFLYASLSLPAAPLSAGVPCPFLLVLLPLLLLLLFLPHPFLSSELLFPEQLDMNYVVLVKYHTWAPSSFSFSFSSEAGVSFPLPLRSCLRSHIPLVLSRNNLAYLHHKARHQCEHRDDGGSIFECGSSFHNNSKAALIHPLPYHSCPAPPLSSSPPPLSFSSSLWLSSFSSPASCAIKHELCGICQVPYLSSLLSCPTTPSGISTLQLSENLKMWKFWHYNIATTKSLTLWQHPQKAICVKISRDCQEELPLPLDFLILLRIHFSDGDCELREVSQIQTARIF